MSTAPPTHAVPPRPVSPALRATAGVLLVIATLAHVDAALFVPRALFVVLFVLSALGTALGAALLLRTPRLGWLVGGVVSLLTALGYVQRSTIGFFGILPPQPFLRPLAGPVSAIAEILVVVLAAWALSATGSLRRGALRDELRSLAPDRHSARRTGTSP